MKKIVYIRTTKETKIKVRISLIDNITKINTSIKFFDHLLEQFSFHSKIGVCVKLLGDKKIDYHHIIEDVGIVIGKIFEILSKKKINRYSNSFVPMDESLSNIIIDISGRGGFFTKSKLKGKILNFNSCLIYDFFNSFTFNSKYTIHLVSEGYNLHHRLESIFKSFGLSINKLFFLKTKNNSFSTK
ncbi:imidazoleglycerol-phosphate dehydratase HisB [Candidatus Vidania fulgoroideorum]